MTLSELANKIFRYPDAAVPAIVYVFDHEDYLESWLRGEQDVYITFVIQSDFKSEVWLKDKWNNAEVDQIYCIDKDKMAVVISKEG